MKPAPADDWTADRAKWPGHVDAFEHPRAIENSARKHRFDLGYEFLVLLARRLRAVDVDADGAALALATAWARVEGWAREGRLP